MIFVQTTALFYQEKTGGFFCSNIVLVFARHLSVSIDVNNPDDLFTIMSEIFTHRDDLTTFMSPRDKWLIVTPERFLVLGVGFVF
jgi:hypothetical protein